MMKSEILKRLHLRKWL